MDVLTTKIALDICCVYLMEPVDRPLFTSFSRCRACEMSTSFYRLQGPPQRSLNLLMHRLSRALSSNFPGLQDVAWNRSQLQPITGGDKPIILKGCI